MANKTVQSGGFLLQMLTIGGLFGIYALACGFLYTRQTRFIFKPSDTIETTPAAYQQSYEEVWLPIKTAEGTTERMHCWWMPAPRANAPTLLYLHGNGINMGANVEHAYRFHRFGLSVLSIDYRGYGLSEGGFPTEQTVYADARRAWDYLTLERHLRPDQILIYGHSLGGAVALDLATRHPEAAGLIVQSSFTSMLEMVQREAWTRAFPMGLLLNQRFDSIAKVPSLQLPTLYIHGTADDFIPAQMSEQLYLKTQAPKQIRLFAGAGHTNVAEVAGPAYFEAIAAFLETARHHGAPS